MERRNVPMLSYGMRSLESSLQGRHAESLRRSVIVSAALSDLPTQVATNICMG